MLRVKVNHLTANEQLRSKRQQILDAAYVVFSQKGFNRATVDEIIAMADTGKGTVYNYFVNKEQLFYTLVRERSAPFEASLGQVARSDTPTLEKIEAMIKLFLQFYAENADLWRVTMHEMRGFGPNNIAGLTEEQRQKYGDTYRNTIGMLAEVLDEAVAQGLIRQCNTSKTAYGLFSVIITMVFQKFIDDFDTMAHGITNVFLYGIAKR